ncbi:MAG: hypothetical protein ABSF61_07775 [Anaerolineales bacterium]|jgi:hypothetical protein
MKLRKLLPFLLAVALIACVPNQAPTANPPVIQHTTDTAAPPTNTSPSPTNTAERATNAPPTGTPTALVVSTIPGPTWVHQTKTSGCAASGALPDPACTPGDILPDVTKDQVCTPGYSSSVRNVPASEKDQVYGEYGIVSPASGQYEVDHFVSLELGGSNDISNLWPEAADPKPGFHEKDQVENYLHDQVCYGTMTLTQAQEEIATNWLAVYETLPGAINPPQQSTPAPSNTQAALPTQPQVVPTQVPQSTAPQPQPTAAASGFTLNQLTSPVARGGNASARIQTAAGAACSIGYVTPSGNQSTAQGLVSETANGNGVCAWTWKIGPSTKQRTGTVTITANGATQSFPIVVE